jgi:hypothetical protein
MAGGDKVFAVDFFDDKLWENILDSAQNGDFLSNVFFCKNCCKKMNAHLFTERQWKMLLDKISAEQETLILQYLQMQTNYNNNPLELGAGKKFLYTYYTKDTKDDDNIKVEKFKLSNCMDASQFKMRDVPGDNIGFYIKMGLRKKVYEAYGKETKFNIHVKDRKGWLYYFSKNKGNTGKHVVYCPNIPCRCLQCDVFLSQKAEEKGMAKILVTGKS